MPSIVSIHPDKRLKPHLDDCQKHHWIGTAPSSSAVMVLLKPGLKQDHPFIMQHQPTVVHSDECSNWKQKDYPRLPSLKLFVCDSHWLDCGKLSLPTRGVSYCFEFAGPKNVITKLYYKGKHGIDIPNRDIYLKQIATLHHSVLVLIWYWLSLLVLATLFKNQIYEVHTKCFIFKHLFDKCIF